MESKHIKVILIDVPFIRTCCVRQQVIKRHTHTHVDAWHFPMPSSGFLVEFRLTGICAKLHNSFFDSCGHFSPWYCFLLRSIRFLSSYFKIDLLNDLRSSTIFVSRSTGTGFVPSVFRNLCFFLWISRFPLSIFQRHDTEIINDHLFT